MRTIFYITAIFLSLYACKNTSEERETAEASLEEKPVVDIESEIEIPEYDSEEAKESDSEKEETREKSIFDIIENMVYIKKESLDEMELAALKDVMEKDPELAMEKLIQDIGPEFALDLPSLKSHFSEKNESFTTVRDILERNVTQGSISMGYEINGRERIRAYSENPTGGFLEDMTEYYMFKGRSAGKTALRRLGVASDDNVIPILMEYFEVTEDELGLLKSFPRTEAHSNSLSAKATLNFEIPASVETHLNSPECSEGFKQAVAFFKKRQSPQAKRFMLNANKAKDAFYKLNPGWYGEDDDIGVTYIDSRRKYIYLPFGALSFADRVISHELGTDGANSEGVIGEPDMAIENFRLADPRVGNLGIKGVLTVEFTNNALTDVNGPDLYVFEMGKIEPTKLEISKDGKDWLEIGKIEGGTAKVDIAPYVQPGETFNYIRLTDLETWSTVPGADVDAIAAIGGAVRLNIDSAVLFDTAEYELKESAASELEKLLEAIKEIPEGTIIVEGHTDNVGSPGSNLTLSQNRAREVANYLKSNLPDTYKYSIKGHGETRPVAINDTDENKQKNRRVEILIIPANN
jgi:outer membrane protein OmpA-like peptidoglycan-associated protein